LKQACDARLELRYNSAVHEFRQRSKTILGRGAQPGASDEPSMKMPFPTITVPRRSAMRTLLYSTPNPANSSGPILATKEGNEKIIPGNRHSPSSQA
jgi:hypothetical protein